MKQDGNEDIFKSRLLLKFDKKEIEENYKKDCLERFPSVINTNIITSLFLLLIAVANLTTSQMYLKDSQLILILIVISIASGVLTVFSLILTVLTLSSFKFLQNKKRIIGTIILGMNYLILENILIVPCALYSGSTTITIFQSCIFLLICTTHFILKIFYVFFFIKCFSIIFTTSIINLLFQGLLIGLCFDPSMIGLFINTLIISICLNFIGYSNEITQRLHWYIQQFNNDNKKAQSINLYKKLCEQLDHSIFMINKNGKINFMNKSMRNLIKAPNNFQFENELEETENELAKPKLTSNLFNLYISNNKFFPKRNSTQIVLPSIRIKNDNTEIINSICTDIKKIFTSLSYINEDLAIYNKNLYDYLYILKSNNKLSDTFDLSNLFNIIKSDMKEVSKNYEERKVVPRYKTSELNPNIYLLVSNTENNTIKEIGNIMETERNTKTLRDSQKRLTISNFKRSSFYNSKEYIFLGKTFLKKHVSVLPLNKNEIEEEKEYFISCLFIPEINHISFIFEDYSQHMKRERKEVANVCRSLYLSKISHELKNPICNLLEIVSLLNDEIANINFHKKIKNQQSNKKIISAISSNSDSIIEGGDSSADSLMSLDQIKSKNLLNVLDANLKILKSIGEMMNLIFKDFSFYSNLFEKSTESNLNTNQNTQFNSESNLNSITESPKDFENRKKLKKKLSKVNLTKMCNFKEIVKEVVNIFKAKIEIDNKSNKLTLSVTFENNIPDIIDCDKDLFKSLVFNLLYHLYKTTQSGNIELKIAYTDVNRNSTEILHPNLMKKLLFDFNVNGVIDYKNMLNKQLINENEENDADSSNSCSDDTILDNMVDIKIDKSVNKEFNTSFRSTHDKNPTFSENFLRNILVAGNSLQRNNYIDEFNKNFQFIISNIYAKKIGIKLNFDVGNNGKSSRIYFDFDVKKTSFNRFSKNNLTLKNLTGSNKSKGDIKSTTNIPEMKVSAYEPSEPLQEDVFTKIKENFITKYQGPDTINSFYLYGSNNTFKPRKKEISDVSDLNKTDNTILNSGELNFNYQYYINKHQVVRNLIDQNNDITRKFYFKPENEVVINHGNIIINHNYPIVKLSSQSTSQHVRNPYQRINNRCKTDKKSNKFPNYSSKNLTKNTSPPKKTSEFAINLKKIESKFKIHSESSSNTSNNSVIIEKQEDDIQFKSIKSIKSINQKQVRVLLCDDENLIRKTLNRFFNLITKDDSRFVFDVQHSENGFECLSKIYDYYNEGKYFDMLIIDETMPLIKGSQIIFLLKSIMKENNLKNITIISFTSYDTPEKKDFIFSQGADHVIGKPIKYEDFKNFFIDHLLQDRSENLSLI